MKNNPRPIKKWKDDPGLNKPLQIDKFIFDDIPEKSKMKNNPR